MTKNSFLMENIIESFQYDLELRGLSPSTIEYEMLAAKRFFKFLDGKPLETIDKEDIKKYLAIMRSRKMRSTTINTAFFALNSFLDFLVEDGTIENNPIKHIRKKYLKSYKTERRERQIISVQDATKLVKSILDVRDKAIILLLLKTGIRQKELIELDVKDIDFKNMSIRLKPTAKRSNRLVFFDRETEIQLMRWLHTRSNWNPNGTNALFINRRGLRLTGKLLQKRVTMYASNVGLDKPYADDPKDRFSPHNCRHFFTTYLMRAGMKREYVQWLRGDKIHEAIDIYYHIDPDDVREQYLELIPKLGV